MVAADVGFGTKSDLVCDISVVADAGGRLLRGEIRVASTNRYRAHTPIAAGKITRAVVASAAFTPQMRRAVPPQPA
jgi:hypothetical protein